MFAEMTRSARWRALEAKGARPQRLLWASTGTKNPEYSDVMYVDSLIVPDTIATLPPDTLKRFEDHGRISNALDASPVGDARRVLNALATGGIDLADVNRRLEEEGISKFARSFDKLLNAIRDKRRVARGRAAEPGGTRTIAASGGSPPSPETSADRRNAGGAG
jgi:transaldolase